MLKVGLTGGIASGKSTIAAMFRRLGAQVVDADQVARRVVEPGRPALKEIAEAFGGGVLRPDGSLDRGALARIVFADAGARARLNAILHPRIWKEEDRLFQMYEAQSPEGIVILDAAVLIESGGAGRMDLMVVVDVDEEDQLRRLASKGMPREEALARIRAQMPTAEKLKRADYVIDNRGSLERTRRRVGSIWRALVSRAGEKKIDKR
ncbi:MAG: dephospho-CoA kinase [Candidatus Tectomicrobia bacterium]|nr:dephospho-CoA kinase [Candidatus Tectomicrobia bacterium]